MRRVVHDGSTVSRYYLCICFMVNTCTRIVATRYNIDIGQFRAINFAGARIKYIYCLTIKSLLFRGRRTLMLVMFSNYLQSHRHYVRSLTVKRLERPELKMGEGKGKILLYRIS